MPAATPLLAVTLSRSWESGTLSGSRRECCNHARLSHKAVCEDTPCTRGSARQSRRAGRPCDGPRARDRRDGRFRNPPLEAIQRPRRGFMRQPHAEAEAATARSADESEVLSKPASGIRDEFEQVAVGAAGVHARSLAARTVAPHRAKLDLHAVGAQVVDRAFDWSRPHEAEIASTRLYRKPRNRVWFTAGSMDVELLFAEAVHRNTVWVADELRAEDIAVEGV